MPTSAAEVENRLSVGLRLVPRIFAGIVGLEVEKYGARTHRTTSKVWSVTPFGGDHNIHYEIRGQAGIRGVANRNSVPEFEDGVPIATDFCAAPIHPNPPGAACNCYSPT